jgi:hypothetical protein
MKKKRLRLQKPNLRVPKPHVPKRFKRMGSEERSQEAINSLPRITNETVAEHREEVLRGARKYIYPLEHSKHRIVVVSTALLIVAVVGFFVYCGLALYRFETSSSFMYRVTQVLPFPVAKAGSRYVAYENYLFELRRYKHYYETQQQADFADPDQKRQLESYKPKAMQQVVDAAYVKELASKHNVKVTETEVNAALEALRAQNHLGQDNQELADVTRVFFGWSLDDLRRELRQELLAQKVAAKLDTDAQTRAQDVLQKVQAGVDFGTLAGQLSDDAATKAAGGKYANTAITTASTDVPPQVVRALLKLQPGQTSEIITTGSTLEVVKLLANEGGKLQAAHISVNIKPISTYTDPLKKTSPPQYFIAVK